MVLWRAPLVRAKNAEASKRLTHSRRLRKRPPSKGKHTHTHVKLLSEQDAKAIADAHVILLHATVC